MCRNVWQVPAYLAAKKEQDRAHGSTKRPEVRPRNSKEGGGKGSMVKAAVKREATRGAERQAAGKVRQRKDRVGKALKERIEALICFTFDLFHLSLSLCVLWC